MSNQDLTLCIFRHGQTDWNLAGRFQGHIDIPLNDTGYAQADALADQCAALHESYPIAHIYSSDLKRASHTARAVSTRLELPDPTCTEVLREAQMGQVEGLNRDEVVELVGERFMQLWLGDPGHPDAATLRFEGGESRVEVVKRVLSLIEDIKHTHPGQTIGLSSHGGVVRHMLGALLPDQHARFARVPNATLFVIRWHTDTHSWSLLHAPGSD